jgi:hypothetical protein
MEMVLPFPAIHQNTEIQISVRETMDTYKQTSEMVPEAL